MTDEVLDAVIRERAGRRWCLFLDRDGVINTRIHDGYVTDWDSFVFEPGALDALRILAQWAPTIVMVSNQQGIGKGLMSTEDLGDIHARMLDEIVSAGGRLDALCFCPHLAADACDCRKPQPGMPLAFLQGHPEVDGTLSIMVGDTDSDVAMGRRLAAHTGGAVAVRIHGSDDPQADLTFPSLTAFADAVACALDAPTRPRQDTE